MKHLQKIALDHKGLFVIYFLIGLTQTFLQSFGSRYFQTVIDRFTAGTLTLGSIAIYGSAMIALYVINYVYNYPARKLEHSVYLDLKTAALRKVSVIDYLQYQKLGTGTLIQRIENGAAAGRGMLYYYWLRLASELLPAMAFSILFILAISKAVMLAILVGYVAVFAISRLLLQALYRVKERILSNEEAFNHVLVRGFMEMVVFRVYRRFGAELEKARRAKGEIVSAKVRMTLIHEAFFTAFAVLIGFVKIGILIYGWSTRQLSIGEIVALIALVDNAYTPIAIFNVLYVEYKLDRTAYARYAQFLDAAEDPQLAAGEPVQSLRGEMSFHRVDYGYGEGRLLRGLDLTIAGGSTAAFVGESGSGKSTAVKLLVGLLKPQVGSVRVDGKDLGTLNLNSYYAHIAYLPQDPPVFDGTLRENLVFDHAVEEEELMEALRQVGLEALCRSLEKGLDTPLGERGVSLSGGQRQQLALARLWFTDASVVILDEATSAIDNLTEQRVMAAVMRRLRGKTVLAIAHRLDSIRDFEDIVVWRDGCVVERGGFGQLLERRQYFHELYHRVAI